MKTMKNFITRKVSHLSVFGRFKSGKGTTENELKGPSEKEFLKRMNKENDLLFGNVLESEKARLKRLSGMKTFPFQEQDDYVYVTLDEELKSIEYGDKVEDMDENAGKSDESKKSVQEDKADDKKYILEYPLYNADKPVCENDLDYHITSMSVWSAKNIHFPAVSRVLQETMPKTSVYMLKRWKEKLVAQLGKDGFENYNSKQLIKGTLLHGLIKRRLTMGDGDLQDMNIPPDLEGCWESLQPVFPLVKNIKAMENGVIHPHLRYRGVVDCIAQFRDNVVIIDWKRSDKHKPTIKETYDNPVQLAAYIGAVNHDQNYPFKIEEALIIVSYEDGSKADIFYLKKETLEKYWKLWTKRLHEYFIKVSATEVIDDLKIRY